jgi:ribosomal protein S18 acetylase RimI-like enzyme
MESNCQQMRGYAPARCAQVSRRPATAADADYLRALFTESRDDLLVLPDVARAALLDMQYRGQGRQIAAGHPAATREVLVADGADAGLLILDRDPERVHVVDIVVARAHRRRGIASGTLRAVIDEAGGRTVTLSVWPGNVIARSLYERLGFVPSTPSQIPGGYLPMEHRPGQ